jgi:hypothetical protein
MNAPLTAEEVELALDWEKLYLGGTIITMEQVELAERVLDFIHEHPDAHSQSDWLTPGRDPHTSDPVTWMDRDTWEGAIDCGTKACFAGWTAVLDGQEVFVGDMATLVTQTGHAETEDLPTWAANRLGLPPYDARQWAGPSTHPFAPHNTVRELTIWVHAMRLRATMLEIAAGLRKSVEAVPATTAGIQAEDAWKKQMIGGRRG